MQRPLVVLLAFLALAAMPATQAQLCTPIEAICTGEDRPASKYLVTGSYCRAS